MQKTLFSVLFSFFLLLPLRVLAVCPACSCTVNNTSVAFGNYAPMSTTPLDSNGSLVFTCGGPVSALVNYDISIGTGSNSSNFITRRMASGADLLNYNLYTSNTYSTVWGDGTGGSQKVSGSVIILLASGTTTTVLVYGRIPSSQTIAKPGVYSDAAMVTVTYN